jgi:hypothetical protein
MLSSLTDLANQTLRRLGAGRVSSISAEAEEAVVLNELWPQARDEVLRDHDWSIATTRAELAELSVTNLTEYSYVYQVPTDCLRILGLLAVEGTAYYESPDLPFMLEGDRLYCDESPLYARYIKQESDVSKYDATLAEAVILKLAYLAAFQITGSTEMEDRMLQKYTAWLEKAKNLDAIERAERISGPWGFTTAIADETVE